MLGVHTLENGRIYKIEDTGREYVGGEYPSGGLLITTKLNSGNWSYIDNSPDYVCVKNFLRHAALLTPNPELWGERSESSDERREERP